MTKAAINLNLPPILAPRDQAALYSLYGTTRLLAQTTVSAPPEGLAMDIDQGYLRIAQSLAIDLAVYGNELLSDHEGAYFADLSAGLIYTTAGKAGESQAVFFPTPLAAPGSEVREAGKALRVEHRYGIPGEDRFGNDAPVAHAPLSEFRGNALSAVKGWHLVDGDADTVVDLRNVVSRTGMLNELAIGWNHLEDSPFARYDKQTQTYVIDAAKPGFLGVLALGNPDVPVASPSLSDVLVGVYARSSPETVSHRVEGMGGNDRVIAGASAITFDGGLGIDTMDYQGIGDKSGIVLSPTGVAGVFTVAKTLVDQMVFSEGSTTVRVDASHSLSGRAIYQEKAARALATDTLKSVETVIGSPGNDKMTGDDSRNIFDGGNGNDRIFTRGGDDLIYGSLGNDRIDGGKNDASGDVLDYSHLDAPIIARLSDDPTNGGGYVYKAVTTDTVKGIEHVIGTSFNDVLEGDGSDNILRGEDGDDVLYATAGRDSLFGGAGNDTLFGKRSATTYFDGGGGSNVVTAQGDSVIYGDIGNSTLIGGAGTDAFIFDNTTRRDVVIAQPPEDGSSPGSIPVNPLNDSITFHLLSVDLAKFSIDQRDLLIDVLGTATHVRIKDWFGEESIHSTNTTISTICLAAPDFSLTLRAPQIVQLVQDPGALGDPIGLIGVPSDSNGAH